MQTTAAAAQACSSSQCPSPNPTDRDSPESESQRLTGVFKNSERPNSYILWKRFCVAAMVFLQGPHASPDDMNGEGTLPWKFDFLFRGYSTSMPCHMSCKPFSCFLFLPSPSLTPKWQSFSFFSSVVSCGAKLLESTKV